MADSQVAVELVDNDVMDRLIGYIRDNSTDLAESALQVPTAHFTSRERADAEIALLKSRPLLVGHISDVPDAGSFITTEVLGIGLLIVRQKDGSVGVFRNMCRHRGGQVEDAASGRKQIFMCAYHGWSYGAEGGALKAVPYEETAGRYDRACNSLIRFPSEVRHGMIFASLSGEPMKAIAEYLTDGIDSQIAPWRLEESICLIDETVALDINWKLVMDGTIDSLHAQFLHPKPGGVGSRSVNHSAVFKDYGPHGKMFMARAKLKKLIDAGEDVSGSSKYIGSVMHIYPNVVFVEAPEHLELWGIWPDVKDPCKCTVRFRFFVRPEIQTPEMEARVHKSWDILREAGMEEDFPMEASIQRNAETSPGAMFQYGRNEKCAQHLHRQLFEDIDGGVAGPDTIRFL